MKCVITELNMLCIFMKYLCVNIKIFLFINVVKNKTLSFYVHKYIE